MITAKQMWLFTFLVHFINNIVKVMSIDDGINAMSILCFQIADGRSKLEQTSSKYSVFKCHNFVCPRRKDE